MKSLTPEQTISGNRSSRPYFTIEGEIYEDGDISDIHVNDIKDNEVAIRQLINSHNLLHLRLEEKNKLLNKLSKKKPQNLPLSTFILCAVMTLIGNVLSGISTNQITAGNATTADKIVLVVAIILLAIGALVPTILLYKANKNKTR